MMKHMQMKHTQTRNKSRRLVFHLPGRWAFLKHFSPPTRLRVLLRVAGYLGEGILVALGFDRGIPEDVVRRKSW